MSVERYASDESRFPRARKKIRAAVAAKGYAVDFIEWEPVCWSSVAEKSIGPDGGWTVWLTEETAQKVGESGMVFPGDNVIFGQNVREVLANIAEVAPKPSETQSGKQEGEAR